VLGPGGVGGQAGGRCGVCRGWGHVCVCVCKGCVGNQETNRLCDTYIRVLPRLQCCLPNSEAERQMSPYMHIYFERVSDGDIENRSSLLLRFRAFSFVFYAPADVIYINAHGAGFPPYFIAAGAYIAERRPHMAPFKRRIPLVAMVVFAMLFMRRHFFFTAQICLHAICSFYMFEFNARRAEAGIR